MPLADRCENLQLHAVVERPKTSLMKSEPKFAAKSTKNYKSKENIGAGYKFSANSLKRRSPMNKNERHAQLSANWGCKPFAFYTPQAPGIGANKDMNFESAVAEFPVFGGYLLDPENAKIGVETKPPGRDQNQPDNYLVGTISASKDN